MRPPDETENELFAETTPEMTADCAAYVRRLRCDEGRSWRGVARACYEAWGGDWYPSSNQLIGMEFCQRAAGHFGEDPRIAPWN